MTPAHIQSIRATLCFVRHRPARTVAKNKWPTRAVHMQCASHYFTVAYNAPTEPVRMEAQKNSGQNNFALQFGFESNKFTLLCRSMHTSMVTTADGGRGGDGDRTS